MDWANFFSMGGYGFYVWGSYLAALIAIGGEVFILLRRKKKLQRAAPRGRARREIPVSRGLELDNN
jgi:heme exporter protein D